MKKRRSKRWKWLAWTAGIIVSIALIGFWSWNYAIDYFMNSMIADMEKQLELELELELEQLWAESGDQANWIAGGGGQIGEDDGIFPDLSTPVSSDSSSISPASSSGTAASSSASSQDGGGVTGSVGGEPLGSTEGHGGSQAVSGNEAGHTMAPLTYEPEISVDKAKKTQDSMTMKEKRRITTILLKRLSIDDMRMLISTASGGVTVDEKRAAKRLFLEKLTEEEYNELISIAAQYGLSHGEDYQSSIAGEKHDE